jgi:hypothetical protein
VPLGSYIDGRAFIRPDPMSSSPHFPPTADPLSGRSITVRFIHHPDYLEAVLHGFVNVAASKAALHEMADEVRRTGAQRLLVDTGPLIGQLTQSEHALIGELVATLFASVRVAGIAPVGRPVGEIAPTARRNGADYLGFATRAEALAWLHMERDLPASQ